MENSSKRMPESDQPLLPEGELLRLNDWAEPAGWMLALFAGLAGLFLLLTNPAPGGNLGGPLRPVLAVAWLGLAFLAGSGARAGLIARSDGIEVRFRLRSSRFAWSDISTFELHQAGYRPSLRVRLADSRELHVAGFSARSPEEVDRAEAMVAELNRRLCRED